MKPTSEEGTAWSQYELTPIERLKLKDAAYSIASILTSRFTRKGGIFWMGVSEDLTLMAEQGVSYVGRMEAPVREWVRVYYYLLGIVSGVGAAFILGWHP